MDSDADSRLGFRLRYQDGWAVLTITGQRENRRPVYADDITARMRLLNIPPVSQKRIRDIIQQKSGEAEQLVEWPAGASLGGRVYITVSDDMMDAVARIEAPHPGGAPVNMDDIKSALTAAGVRRGIDRSAISALLSNASEAGEIVVATGVPPVDGCAARSETLFIADRGKPWKELSGGRVDLKELNFIQNRKAGDVLARHLNAREAIDGYTVTGEKLYAAPVPEAFLLIAGEGVEDTGKELIALVDGNARLVDGVVSVEPLVVVDNVDYSTGNLDFDGSVVVEGTVADGFTIKADGDLQIGKSVGRCRLESGRNLVLTAGLVGDGDGVCRVGGSLFAKFIESARGTVAGDTVVSEALLHSELDVDGDLLVYGGRGEITGGLTVVGGSLVCKRIGNLYSGGTRIYVGTNPAKLASFQKLALELKNRRDELDESERRLAYFQARPGSTDEERRQVIRETSTLEKIIVSYTENLKSGAHQLKQLRTELEAPAGTQLIGEDRIYSGSTISFGLDEFPLGDKGLERVKLRRENSRTVVHGFRAGEDIGLEGPETP